VQTAEVTGALDALPQPSLPNTPVSVVPELPSRDEVAADSASAAILPTDVTPVAIPEPDASESPHRPVTSEMVALDAFDAFEDVWGSTGMAEGVATPAATSSPLDEAALGSGSDAESVWVDETSAGAEPPESPVSLETSLSQDSDIQLVYPVLESAMPAWLADDEPAVMAAQPEVDWSEVPTVPSADDVIGGPFAGSASTVTDLASEISTDESHGTDLTPGSAAPTPEQAVPLAADTDAWPDQLLAEYAPYAAPSRGTPSQVVAITSDAPAADVTVNGSDIEAAAAAEPSPAEPIALVAAVTLEVPLETSHEPSAGMRISATLDRLAGRVRRGEIDISSVAPDATEAAVLASVLATLLRGSNSR